MAVDSTHGLITLNNLKTYLGISVDDNDYDARLELVINGVSYFFKNECNRQIKAGALTEYYNGHGKNKLFLSTWPVNSITSIGLSTSTPRDYTDDAVDLDYILGQNEGSGKQNGILTYIDGVFPLGVETVKIIWNGGHSTIPPDIVSAVLELCAEMWKKEKDKIVGLQSIAMGGSTLTILAERLASPFVREVINRNTRKYYG